MRFSAYVISMKLSAYVIFLIALRATSTTCQETYSVFSCAIGTKADTPKNQEIATKIFDILNPSKSRLPKDYVFFYLHTKEKPEEHEIIPGDSESIDKSTFDAKRPTKIITHGYLGSKDNPACILPRDALLKSGDYNVIIVDWWKMQSIWGQVPLDYWTVAGFVGEVGSYVATMINFLENHGMNPETTTLIGHSLGAHVMGVAGHNANRKVHYIVGLDPALPAFENQGSGERLSLRDAEIVEVIHTNSGDCGIENEIGHYDFYPNGGVKQLGCISNACSHSRAYEYYAESVYNETSFFARKCDGLEAAMGGTCTGDVEMMGGHSKEKESPYGVYHLKTRESSPFAVGLEQL